MRHAISHQIKALSDRLQSLIEGHLWAKVLVGLAAGTGIGVLLGPEVGLVKPNIANTITSWLAFPGNIFLALIQMIMIPLVFASIMLGLGTSTDSQQLKKLGLWLAAYFLFTTAVATSIGAGLATTIKPGNYIASSAFEELEISQTESVPKAPGTSLADVPKSLVSLLPKNPLASIVESEMLAIVIFAMILGVALITLPKDKKAPLVSLMVSLQAVCMTIVKWAMKLAPIAVFGLMTRLTSQVGFETLVGMSAYVFTVLLGLFLLGVFYMLIVAFAGENPMSFLKKIRQVQLLAFSTSSSAAVMPLSMKTAEEELNISPGVAKLVIPVGATVNMDGTALYQTIAIIFLAQVFNIPLDTSQIAFVIFSTVAASIGSPATPGVGIVILSGIMTSVGIPASGIVLVLGVDRI